MLNKTLFLVAATVIATAASAQTSPSAAAPAAQKPYYYWLHPKLGMVKVDRATNAMITSARPRETRGVAREAQ